MIEKLKGLFGGKQKQSPEILTTEMVNNRVDEEYYISTEVIQKGESRQYTAGANIEIAGKSYERGDTISGVLRDYDGSITIRENVRNHYRDYQEIPMDTSILGNKSPDHVLTAIAVVPGERVIEAESDQYLAVPIWQGE